MKVIKIVFMLLPVALAINVYSQQMTELSTGNVSYYRNGLTVMYLDKILDLYRQDVVNNYSQNDLVPDKYDNNSLEPLNRSLETENSFQSIYERNQHVFGIDLEEKSLKMADDAEKNSSSSDQKPEEALVNTLSMILGEVGAVVERDKIKAAPLYVDDEITNSIKNRLEQQKIGNAIIAKLFNRQPDGVFNTEILSKRGIYTSGASEFAGSLQTVTMDNVLANTGWRLIKKAYVIVMFYNEIETEQQWQNRVQPYSSRNSSFEGYRTDAVGYVFKLDFNDELIKKFEEEMWIDENDDIPEEERKKRAELFESTSFPFVLVSSACAWNVYGKTVEDMLAEATIRSLSGLEKIAEELMVKTPVLNKKSGLMPKIYAKIGTKEGLKKHDRYFVFEAVQNSDGDIINKRVGAVRATKRIDNNIGKTYDKTGNSEFVQISGRKLYPGNTLVEKKDRGEALNLGMGTNGLEIKYSKGKFTKRYISVGYDYNSYTNFLKEDGQKKKLEYSAQMLRAGIGLQHYMYMRSISLGLNLGATYEADIESDSEKRVKYNGEDFYGGSSGKPFEGEELGWFVHLNTGVELGISLGYNKQLFVASTYYLPVKYELYGQSAPGMSTGRGGLQTQFGIRFSR